MGNLKNAYALLIGVGNDLPVTSRDAKAIYNILADGTIARYLPENIILLADEKATRKGILNAFDILIDTTNKDSSVMLYYSGHGGTYSDNTFLKRENWKPEDANQKYFHLCPFDYDPVNYETTWVKAEEVKEKLGQLKSRRLIFFLDCCHAAGMTKSAPEIGLQPKSSRLTQADALAQNLDDGRGMSIISSCREDQLSYILEGDSNSLYTKCMIEVLKGKNKTNFDDPYVRISEVVQYIFKKVPEGHPEQNPYANLQIYDDFILSYIPGESRDFSTIQEESDISNNQAQVVKKELITKFRETENSNSAVLFIHGFSGEAEETFGNAPNLLMADEKMDGWDLFPLGFSGNIVPEMGKNIWACSSDIKRNSDYLITSIKNKFAKYKRIAILAHDLGGIVAQQALLQLGKKDMDRISHVLLFGTPSNGLPEIELKNFFTYGNTEKELKESSPYIKEMRDKWNKKFPNGYPFTFKTVAATRDQYVPISSSLEPFPKEFHEMMEGDHFSIAQIDTAEDDAYQLLLNSLMNKGFLNQFSNKEEINIALGEYSAVINSLLPQLEQLDGKGLERLIYALEAAGREAEALQILQTHTLAKGNSNLLGVMGGRYKRKYLSGFAAQDLQMAFTHYGDALKIAEQKNDYSQLYYHAINLAFLSLMKGEKGEMAGFAEKAFEAAQKDPFPSLWKIATLAEAYLYKGDFENAKENYAKAAQMAGLREKISIHSNAYNAYVSLLQTDNPEDPFIKFLKTHLLS